VVQALVVAVDSCPVQALTVPGSATATCPSRPASRCRAGWPPTVGRTTCVPGSGGPARTGIWCPAGPGPVFQHTSDTSTSSRAQSSVGVWRPSRSRLLQTFHKARPGSRALEVCEARRSDVLKVWSTSASGARSVGRVGLTCSKCVRHVGLTCSKCVRRIALCMLQEGPGGVLGFSSSHCCGGAQDAQPAN